MQAGFSVPDSPPTAIYSRGRTDIQLVDCLWLCGVRASWCHSGATRWAIVCDMWAMAGSAVVACADRI